MKAERLEAIVREHFPMPDDVRKHARAANWDLYYGPLGVDHWREEEGDDSPDYDYVESRSVLVDWIESLGTIYVGDESERVTDREPEGEWLDPETMEPSYEGVYFEPEPYYEVSGRDIADAFGYGELFKS